jgi:hypothetical protein
VQLFDAGSRHKRLDHRLVALTHLKEIDCNLFVHRLIEALEDLPGEAGTSPLSPRDNYIAALVTQTTDPRAWRALEKVAKRSGVALRVEYLYTASEVADAERDECRKERLAFLAAFLRDTTTRDIAHHVNWNSSFAAGRCFPYLEVRSFAAMCAASLLKLSVEPAPDWSDAQWDTLRRQIRGETRGAR